MSQAPGTSVSFASQVMGAISRLRSFINQDANKALLDAKLDPGLLQRYFGQDPTKLLQEQQALDKWALLKCRLDLLWKTIVGSIVVFFIGCFFLVMPVLQYFGVLALLGVPCVLVVGIHDALFATQMTPKSTIKTFIRDMCGSMRTERIAVTCLTPRLRREWRADREDFGAKWNSQVRQSNPGFRGSRFVEFRSVEPTDDGMVDVTFFWQADDEAELPEIRMKWRLIPFEGKWYIAEAPLAKP